jgi:Sulfotransferase family
MTVSSDGSERLASGQRVPDFFIVGHPKSGTTALYEMLRRHPQIYMSELKEPRFFASDLRSRFQGRDAGGFPQTLPEYLALFGAARPEQRVGEASPSYLRSRTAAGAIAELQPQARIIAILREPASFLRSMHLELLQNHVERESDLRRAIAAEAIPPAGGGKEGGNSQQPLLRYTDRVRYVEQLRRYRDVFAPEQVLVLIYDDFRADNEATVRKVLRFLEVDDTQSIEPIEANPSVTVRSRRLDELVRGLYAGTNPASRAIKTTAEALLPERIRSGAMQAFRRRVVYGTPQPVDERLMAELRARFRGEVHALSEFLERDLLTLWGYDSDD